MIPFFVMLTAIVLARAAGWGGVDSLDSWKASSRAGLAVMFVLTASAHFNRMRPDLVRMVPPRFPNPGLMVTLTGVAEFAGAAGLLIPATSRWASFGLALMLVAMFPANIHAARAGVTLGGRQATPLALRLPMQLLWIALLVWIAV